MQRRIFVCLLVLVALSSGCGLGRKPVLLHPTKTVITTIHYHDEERARPLITEVWYPVEETADAKPVSGLWVRCSESRDAPPLEGKYPLIVMSHGNGGDRTNGAWLAEMLAANGYVVAAVDHYGNTWNNKIAECYLRIWERPKDISFVIDQLLTHPVFGTRIDRERIGVVGYSLGGHTGVWIAGGRIANFGRPMLEEVPKDQIPAIVTPEIIESTDFSPVMGVYRDPRVRAAFLMAPALGNLFDGASLAAIEIPVYIVAPEADAVVPVEKSAKILASKIKKAICRMIPGAASHYVFLNEVTKGGKMMLEKAVACDDPTVNRRKIHEETGFAAVEFFRKHL